jgi:RNA polymerase sigma-70 factor (ECF subfamily)
MQGEQQAADRKQAVPASEDVGLCAAVAGGDRDALGQLYDRHASVLMALGVRILGSRAQAEDVLHDVFLEAWHHARDFDPARGSVRAWLVTRMRSRCLDRRASASRRARMATDLQHQEDSLSGARREPGATEGARVDGERLHTQLASLPAELAQLIELSYFDGLSSSEIAERLQIPVGTVKSRMARALATLRQALAESGGMS